MTLLVDLNVILDVLLDREPHVAESARLWAAIERGEARGLVSAHAVTTLHYLLSKSQDREVAHSGCAALLTVFEPAAVDAAVLREALAMGWADFEDAVTAAAARAAACDALVTRDAAGFTGATLPVLAPAEAVALLRARAEGDDGNRA
ncbi:MAG: PIN domain-containing protein [Vicinamibacterales bacterium]|nr:PIN domain-containing protein [Vicinamibacterales bacterium]